MFKKIISAIALIATFATPAVAGSAHVVDGAPGKATVVAAPSSVTFDVNNDFTVQCMDRSVNVRFVKPAKGKKCPIVFVSDELAAFAHKAAKSEKMRGHAVACHPKKGYVIVPVQVTTAAFTGEWNVYVYPWQKLNSKTAVSKHQQKWHKRGWGSFPTCKKA